MGFYKFIFQQGGAQKEPNLPPLKGHKTREAFTIERDTLKPTRQGVNPGPKQSI